MNYMEQDYQKKQIEANQKFLLGLLNFNIGNYYPLRKWLGIDYKGKIDEVSHLSIAYDTKYFKKGKKWFKQQTRVYQQPDLGYKLNLILERIPEVIIPKVGQPSWGLLQMRLLSNTTTTYQPSTADTYNSRNNQSTNYGSDNNVYLGKSHGGSPHWNQGFFRFDLSDINDGATFSDATFSIYAYQQSYYKAPNGNYALSRLLRTDWVETELTWNKYKAGYNWTSAGCNSDGNDYTSTNQLTKSPPLWTGEEGWVNWTSAQTLIQDCWDNASKQINLVYRELWDSEYEWIYYYSKEYTDNTSLRPKLTVTYTAPVDNAILFSCNF